jgi:signal transduction histidine kinase
MASLRTRLLAGAFVWMLAMIVVANVLAFLFVGPVLHRYAGRYLIVHRISGAANVRHVQHILAMSSGALLLIAAGLWLIGKSLAPFNEMRKRLGAVRNGDAQTIPGNYPSEVQPLVNDLNALLEDRERAITRALATAGDLAHGLKTPLAILAQEAERAKAAGDHERAAIIDQQVERMRRQVDYHLAHARATASAGAAPGVRSQVAASVEGLTRTVQRLYADRGLTIDVDVAPEHYVRVKREDLDEMLGNLLDNACKYAKSRIAVTSRQSELAGIVIIDDDGPGLDQSLHDAVLQRGVRADEAAPGSGLGLAIVRDLASLYSGSITLGASPAGGLRARLELPV